MSDKGEQKCELDLNDLEVRKLYNEALKKWDKRLKSLTDSISRAQHITGEDLNIRVGPRHDDDANSYFRAEGFEVSADEVLDIIVAEFQDREA